MKTKLTFTLVLMFGLIGIAQTTDINTIEKRIAIKPILTPIDVNDFALVVNLNTFSFTRQNYVEHITKATNMFSIEASNPEIMRTDFAVFSHKNLKNNFFNDFRTTYMRSELKRLLPRSLDPNYYSPCFGD